MAKKYLDQDGLTTLWGLVKGLFKRFEGANSSKDGTQGEVPAPMSATQDYNKFLKGDGTWATPENTEYSEATQSASGLMSATDKTNLDNAVSKLSGIASGAEVNQNAFGKIIVDGNSTTVDADAKVDTLTFKSGSNVTLTPNATDGSITIAATDTTYTPASANPLMDGTVAVGTSTKYAREDHVHPTDTSRAPTSHASTATTYGKGTDTNYGHVKLSDSTTATTAAASGGTAATPKAVSDALAAAKSYAKSYADGLDTGVSDVTVDGTSVVTDGVANVVLSGKVDKVSGKGLSTNDFTDTDKTNLDNAVSKLNGIANGAEVNQDAFSIVKVGTTNLSADTKTDTLTITAGDHITLTPTETSNSFSIAASFADATQTASGLMSSDDKTKLDGLSTSQVTGVKGNSETNYRTGQVNITAANIGLGNVDNTADANKSVKSAGTLTTSRTIDGVSFNGSANIIHYGTCSIAVGTAAKTCTDMPAFTLAKGARAIIKFTNGNTATNPTLNIKSTGAKAIYYKGARTVNLAANGTYEFVYDGSYYQLIGELDTDTTYSAATTSADGLMSSTDYNFLHGSDANSLSGTYATKSELSTAVSGLYKYKGSVANEDELNAISTKNEGDVYNITAASNYGGPGTNVAWTGTTWDSLGSLFYIEALTTTDIQTICT